ncbi:CapA family protein [Mesotoga sp.]|uniref:CapA family protein n=1 Tax=Mesotoga sp. TaxID=2053577 RepID=UPI001BD2D934|nr:CapA family protein [Mesotoga sp.]
MKIIIGGDLVPTESNNGLFENGDVEALLGKELLNIWRDSDIRIFNLEVPLTDKEDPIEKCGPNLIAPTKTVKGIKALEPSLVSLANNHILDQGPKGLSSTRDVLSEIGIPYIGVGDNLAKAAEPYIIEKDGIKLGVYSCAEHEFSIATESTPGANPFDPLESLDHILSLKNRCDFVIVLYHGGKEHYRYPSPYLQKVCRKMVEKGADSVITQHSHCIGCYEQYEGSTIVYGQGNFIFDHSESEFWKTSLLVEVNLSNSVKTAYIPIVKAEEKVRVAEAKKAEEILTAFNKRSQEILSPGFVEEKYSECASRSIDTYLRKLAGYGRWLSALDRKILGGLLLRRKYSKRKLLAIQNYIECEAHRELLHSGIVRYSQILDAKGGR